MRSLAGGVAVPVLAMALGHMLSNMVRTLPAIAADQMVGDLAITPGLLAVMLGAFQLSFAAGQLPLGVALDRFGVRRTSLTLFAIVLAGIVVAAITPGAAGFLLAQVVMGIGCCGMLLCPITYAAKRLSGARFAVWPGLLLGLGNSGMLLSASPLAWLVERADWRAGFWASACFGVLAMLLVAILLKDDRPPAAADRPRLAGEVVQVVRMMGTRKLRALIVVAFVSFAGMIGVRGLWGGPWLMEVKGLGRLEAGNILLLATVALAVGPALAGLIARLSRNHLLLLFLGHALSGVTLLLIVAGGPDGWVSSLFGMPSMPPLWDTGMLLLFGIFQGSQALIFVMTRAGVAPEEAGKALAAVNFSFFVGAAVLQIASGAAAELAGPGGGIAFFGLALSIGTGLAVRWR
ncbi:MFS transporter [Acetobacteraceae bacterium H6797]|nr:MFS transporter [Acetobacteraceae bacterium H6797]